ncbi:hypothetical protein Nmel_014047 [Mimus melanotis]
MSQDPHRNPCNCTRRRGHFQVAGFSRENILLGFLPRASHRNDSHRENRKTEARPNCGINPRTKLFKRRVWRVH